MKELSIVIPVFNEAENLLPLFDQLREALEKITVDYEIIFINDGSTDRSLEVLRNFHKQLPQQIVIIDFICNFGQHMAIVAGFEKARGKWIITLDADLQNPPAEIEKLWTLAQQGYDLVSGVRLYHRKDGWLRCKISIFINYLRRLITNLKMTDHGCMLRCYRDYIVKLIANNQDRAAFIPALAYTYARNPIETEVRHEARNFGSSRYNLYKLVRLNFDLMTGYSLIPIQLFSVIGILTALGSLIFVGCLFLRRLLIGPEVQGVFTLFAIVFFLIGIVLLGLGIIGEYIGRIYQNVRGNPRFVIRELIEGKQDEKNTPFGS